MNSLLIPICLGIIFFIAPGCKKGHHDSANNSIKGEWDLKQIRGQLTIDYDPGNGNLIKFTDTTYEIIISGDVASTSGTYKLVNDSTAQTETGILIEAGTYTRRIIYDNKINDQKVFIEIKNNTLTFLSGYFPVDGGSFKEYIRK